MDTDDAKIDRLTTLVQSLTEDVAANDACGVELVRHVANCHADIGKLQDNFLMLTNGVQTVCAQAQLSDARFEKLTTSIAGLSTHFRVLEGRQRLALIFVAVPNVMLMFCGVLAVARLALELLDKAQTLALIAGLW